MTPIKPAILKIGDKVGLVCPASRPSNPSALRRSAWLLEQVGFCPVIGDNVLKIDGFSAGTDRDRLDDLHRFFLDSQIKAICCVSGGYGSLSLVDKIDFEIIRRHPKMFVGSDDVTSLLLAIHKITGLVTMYGPNLEQIQTIEAMQGLKAALTNDHSSPLLVDEVKIDHMDQEHPSVVEAARFAYSPVKRRVEGSLIGGNLTALVALMGTPFQPEFTDTILLLEDIDERLDILDRWFTTLYVAGALEATGAVAIGKFENCHSNGAKNVLSLEETFGDRLIELGKPCCFNFSFGQVGKSGFVPIGARAVIDTAQGRIDYLESAYNSQAPE